MTSFFVEWQMQYKQTEREKMFEHVIVPLDRSPLAEQVVPYAAGLATAFGASLELLHVIDPANTPETRPDEANHGIFLTQVLDEREAEARGYLEAVAKPFREQGVRVETRVAFGRPEEGIMENAFPERQHLVVMATHGRSGVNRWVMGSVANKLVHEASMPLLLYRPTDGKPGPHQPPKTVVVPLDGSELAERALPLAGYLGRQLGARVLLTRVVIGYESNAFALVAAGENRYQVLPEQDAETREYLDQRVHGLCLDRVNADCSLTLGDPADEVIRLAANAPDSLIVMSTHGRGGFARMVLGSVADKVVCESGAPVLLLRASKN